MRSRQHQLRKTEGVTYVFTEHGTLGGYKMLQVLNKFAEISARWRLISKLWCSVSESRADFYRQLTRSGSPDVTCLLLNESIFLLSVWCVLVLVCGMNLRKTKVCGGCGAECQSCRVSEESGCVKHFFLSKMGLFIVTQTRRDSSWWSWSKGTFSLVSFMFENEV